MIRNILKSKLHRVTITGANLNYEGSFSIDANILDEAEILENEVVHVYNVTNGKRFSTYALKASPGSKIFEPNGACAHLANPGDIVIICTYVFLNEQELKGHQPLILLFNKENQWERKSNTPLVNCI